MMEDMGKLFDSYLLIINAVAFVTFGIDKFKAKRRAWRIPEKTLFGLALVGGSIGAMVGMLAFHHKTKHWSFVVGMPLILALQVAVGLLLHGWTF